MFCMYIYLVSNVFKFIKYYKHFLNYYVGKYFIKKFKTIMHTIIKLFIFKDYHYYLNASLLI